MLRAELKKVVDKLSKWTGAKAATGSAAASGKTLPSKKGRSSAPSRAKRKKGGRAASPLKAEAAEAAVEVEVLGDDDAAAAAAARARTDAAQAALDAEDRAAAAAAGLVRAIEADAVPLDTVVAILVSAPAAFRVLPPWDGDKAHVLFAAQLDARRCAVAAATHAAASRRASAHAVAICIARADGKTCARAAVKAARVAANDATWASTIGEIRTAAVNAALGAADRADDIALAADRAVRTAAKRSGSLDVAIKGHQSGVLAIATLADGRIASASAHKRICFFRCNLKTLAVGCYTACFLGTRFAAQWA